MAKRKDGTPRVTPDLSVEPPKVWVMSYSIRLNGVTISDNIMVPRVYSRQKAGEAVGEQMAFALARILQEVFGDERG